MAESDKTALAHIDAVSQNARSSWFGLIALLAFVGATLLAHAGRNFFAYGAGTQLPLIGISVPTTAFFLYALVLTAAVYISVHVYLVELWDSLAMAPAQVEERSLAARVFPCLLNRVALGLPRSLRAEEALPAAPPRGFDGLVRERLRLVMGDAARLLPEGL